MKKNSDNNLHFLIGKALRIGVILSMTFMFIGCIAYLSRHGRNLSEFGLFKPIKPSVSAIYQGVVSMKATSVIYLGIILLIGTPIMRVLLSVFSFALEKDLLYTVITVLVLLIIFSSIISGHAA